MTVTKPDLGSSDWGPVLNAALDALDSAKETPSGAQDKATAALSAANAYTDSAAATLTSAVAAKADTSSLATVATTGSYTDLTNKPSAAVSSVAGRTGAIVLTADDVTDGTTNKAYTATEKTKLSGIATGATANQSDATTNAAIALKAPLADPTLTGVTTVNGFRLGTVAKSADYTVLASDPSFIAVTTGASVVTMTLPNPSPAGTIYIVKKVDSGAGQVLVGGTMDGSVAPALTAQYDWMMVVSTGTTNNYHIIASNKPKSAAASATDLGVVLNTYGFRGSATTYTLTTSGAITFSGTNLLSGNTALTANVRFSTLAKTAAYTITTSDPYLITGDATTAGFTLTLPATTTQGYIYTIKKIDSTANAVTVAGTLIDGVASVTLAAQNDFINVMSTTTSGTWRVVARGLASERASSTVTVNAQSGTSYVLVAADASKVVEMTNAAANAITVNDVLTTGQEVRIMQTGAGQTTITPGAGVTVNFSSSLTTRAQWSELVLRKRGTNSYVISGDAT